MPSSLVTDRAVHVEAVMGTVVSFDVRSPGLSHLGAIARAVEDMHWIDQTFSTYRAGSAVGRLDRGVLMLADAPVELQWIARRCEELRRETAGYFDARASGRFDPSALVKGWAIQRAARILIESGLHDFCLTGGGDVMCVGGALPADAWRIGIQHPRDAAAIAGIVAGSGLAVATSGAYERGNHILDPHRGVPSRGLLSVTVTGPDLATADAYSTAIYAMGAFGPDWTAGLPPRGYEAMTILGDGTVLQTAGFPLVQARA